VVALEKEKRYLYLFIPHHFITERPGLVASALALVQGASVSKPVAQIGYSNWVMSLSLSVSPGRHWSIALIMAMSASTPFPIHYSFTILS